MDEATYYRSRDELAQVARGYAYRAIMGHIADVCHQACNADPPRTLTLGVLKCQVRCTNKYSEARLVVMEGSFLESDYAEEGAYWGPDDNFELWNHNVLNKDVLKTITTVRRGREYTMDEKVEQTVLY